MIYLPTVGLSLKCTNCTIRFHKIIKYILVITKFVQFLENSEGLSFSSSNSPCIFLRLTEVIVFFFSIAIRLKQTTWGYGKYWSPTCMFETLWEFCINFWSHSMSFLANQNTNNVLDTFQMFQYAILIHLNIINWYCELKKIEGLSFLCHDTPSSRGEKFFNRICFWWFRRTNLNNIS